jgi:hypothetical protein
MQVDAEHLRARQDFLPQAGEIGSRNKAGGQDKDQTSTRPHPAQRAHQKEGVKVRVASKARASCISEHSHICGTADSPVGWIAEDQIESLVRLYGERIGLRYHSADTVIKSNPMLPMEHAFE